MLSQGIAKWTRVFELSWFTPHSKQTTFSQRERKDLTKITRHEAASHFCRHSQSLKRAESGRVVEMLRVQTRKSKSGGRNHKLSRILSDEVASSFDDVARNLL